jgi:hypothetical protein
MRVAIARVCVSLIYAAVIVVFISTTTHRDMMTEASLLISILSLAISATTVWLTLFRRGRLAMTQPNVVFFGFDRTPEVTAKVFLRTLLYSTANRGQVIESMFVKVHQGDSVRVFSFWGCGETNQLVPGSGLYVGQQGIALNHHFVWSLHEQPYEFEPGEYRIEVFARIVGQPAPHRLAEVRLALSENQAAQLLGREGVLFEAQPTGGYIGRVRKQPG